MGMDWSKILRANLLKHLTCFKIWQEDCHTKIFCIEQSPTLLNWTKRKTCHPSLSGSSERSTGRVGRAAGATAVASDAASGPHHRRPRTEPVASRDVHSAIHCEPVHSNPKQRTRGGGQDWTLYCAQVTPIGRPWRLTDTYLTAPCKTPSDVDAGLPSCPLCDQFSTCSTGIFDYCCDLFFSNNVLYHFDNIVRRAYYKLISFKQFFFITHVNFDMSIYFESRCLLILFPYALIHTGFILLLKI